VIRAARPEDYDALCALWREMDDLHARMLPAFFRRTTRPSHPREQFDKILRSPDEHLAVAAVDDELVALAHVQIFDTPPVPQMTPRRRLADRDRARPPARPRSAARRRCVDVGARARGRRDPAHRVGGKRGR
jgi:hypothetical protein